MVQCRFCQGTGKHHNCSGSGKLPDGKLCAQCQGNGLCPMCGGDGQVPSADEQRGTQVKEPNNIGCGTILVWLLFFWVLIPYHLLAVFIGKTRAGWITGIGATLLVIYISAMDSSWPKVNINGKDIKIAQVESKTVLEIQDVQLQKRDRNSFEIELKLKQFFGEAISH